MASGKSTIGKLLAKKLYYSYIDTDNIIERHEGIPIHEIFNQKGETYFREVEKTVLRDITKDCKNQGLVISTGGGMPCNIENLNFMRGNGTIIYLKSSIEDIMKRIINSKTRPILYKIESDGDIKEGIKTLLNQRERYYNQADITVVNNSKTKPLGIVEHIMKTLGM